MLKEMLNSVLKIYLGLWNFILSSIIHVNMLMLIIIVNKNKLSCYIIVVILIQQAWF